MKTTVSVIARRPNSITILETNSSYSRVRRIHIWIMHNSESNKTSWKAKLSERSTDSEAIHGLDTSSARVFFELEFFNPHQATHFADLFSDLIEGSINSMTSLCSSKPCIKVMETLGDIEAFPNVIASIEGISAANQILKDFVGIGIEHFSNKESALV